MLPNTGGVRSTSKDMYLPIKHSCLNCAPPYICVPPFYTITIIKVLLKAIVNTYYYYYYYYYLFFLPFGWKNCENDEKDDFDQ